MDDLGRVLVAAVAGQRPVQVVAARFGIDGPVVLLRVEAASAEYWDSPGGRLASVVSFAKAKLTGRAYDGGENERVDL